MAKLKYGLKKKLQEKTNDRIGSIDLAYDAKNDNILVAVALRNDVNHPELLDRISEVCVKSIGEIKKEFAGEDTDGLKFSGTIPDDVLENLLDFVSAHNKKK